LLLILFLNNGEVTLKKQGSASVKKLLCFGVVLLFCSEAKALECYDLTSEEAAAILDNELDMIQDECIRWKVANVGWELTCLDYCPVGDFEVSEVVVKNGQCVYTITNLAPQDVLGESTTITLKPD